jgi:uncharacterized membrane protein
MNFRTQSRWAWFLGAGTLLVLVAWPAMIFPRGGWIVDTVILAGLAVGGMLIMAGGIARPAHRLIWFRILRPWALGQEYRRTLVQGRLTGPVLQRWLHVTSEGADRDADD